MSERRSLVIAPHGLDEVLGCGGTMARESDAGVRVGVCVLAGDGTGRDAARRVAAARTAEILGTAPPDFVGFSENRLDTVPLVDVVGAVEARLRAIQPDTVYVCHGGNLNIDHQIAFKATLTATRPVPGSAVRELLAYEILSSTDWAFGALAGGFNPQCFVDVGTTLDRKLAALECYGDEVPGAPHARSTAAVRATLTARGATIGVEAAEAFEVIRSVRRQAG